MDMQLLSLINISVSNFKGISLCFSPCQRLLVTKGRSAAGPAGGSDRGAFPSSEASASVCDWRQMRLLETEPQSLHLHTGAVTPVPLLPSSLPVCTQLILLCCHPSLPSQTLPPKCSGTQTFRNNLTSCQTWGWRLRRSSGKQSCSLPVRKQVMGSVVQPGNNS